MQPTSFSRSSYMHHLNRGSCEGGLSTLKFQRCSRNMNIGASSFKRVGIKRCQPRRRRSATSLLRRSRHGRLRRPSMYGGRPDIPYAVYLVTLGLPSIISWNLRSVVICRVLILVYTYFLRNQQQNETPFRMLLTLWTHYTSTGEAFPKSACVWQVTLTHRWQILTYNRPRRQTYPVFKTIELAAPKKLKKILHITWRERSNK